MITINEQPPSIPSLLTTPKAPPVALSDCWKWCLQPDAADAVATPGSRGTLVITFPEITTVPANGSTFKLWGYDFTVDSSTDYTANTFKATTLGLTTVLNFSLMIQANLFFNRAVTSEVDVVGTDFILTITWNECREQPRFAVEDMVFAPGITGIGASVVATNGVSPEYVEGYQLITRLGRFGNTFQGISKFVGIQPDKQCDTVGQVCVEYAGDAATQLYTELPDLTSTSFIPAVQGGNSLMRKLALEYGWVYRENCGAKSGTIKKSGFVLGINAAFDIDDFYGMRRYWYGHPDGFPEGQFMPDFLTTQPKSIPLCWDSFKWLWLLNNWQADFGLYNLKARFIITRIDGTLEFVEHIIDNPSLSGSTWAMPINFNVSPQFVLDNALTSTKQNILHYEVQVLGVDQTTGDALFNASELLKFVPTPCCKGTTDIYFLTPAGGIGTIVVQIDEIETVQDSQEINKQQSCGGDRVERAKYGGRTLANQRSYQQVSFSISARNTSEWERWLKHLRSSPQHWIRMNNEPASNGGISEPFAKKLILQAGSAKTFINGQSIEFKATGYMADIVTQIGTEP